MKILAIRGKNLASLAGGFEIDFQSDPLASAGLFAISGPTGAGKSTILDALCLALYEKTPRLGRAGARGENIPDVGENSIAPSDPRTLLRRGASEGFAEVDFVGNDGMPYRSRWAVRRARNQPGGKLQNSEITLTGLKDMQVLGGHRKTDTLQCIEARIGLSFDQFTRAVLLAQNDFATFLKASDDERAELLQTLTGTGSFAEISIQAYERMKLEKDVLVRLEDQLQGLIPLAPEVRAEKEAARDARTVEVKALEAQQALVETHLRWYQQQHQLAASETDARQVCAAATQAWSDAAGREQQLARIDQVQDGRTLCADVDRLAVDLELAVEAERTARATLEQAALQLPTLQKALEDAEGAMKRADAEKAGMQLQLDEAKKMDGQLAVIGPQRDAAIADHEASRKTLEAALKQVADTEKKLSGIESALKETQGWLDANASLQPLAENWAGWDQMLQEGTRLLVEQSTLRARETEQLRMAAGIAARDSTAREAYARLDAAHKIAHEDLETRTRACEEWDLGKLAHQRQALEARRDQLREAEQVWQKWQQAQSDQQDRVSRQHSLQAALEQCEQALKEMGGRRSMLEGGREAAEQALRIAGLAAGENAEHLRSQLQPDSPCPVCGALEHPYASATPQVDAILAELGKSVEEARQAVDALIQKQGEKQAECKAIGGELGKTAADMLDAARVEKECAGQWLALPLHAELAQIVEQDRRAWLSTQVAAANDALGGVRQEEDKGREALRRKGVAQTAFITASNDLAEARQKILALETEQKTPAEALKALTGRLESIAARLQTLQTQLDGAFSDASWRQRWSDGPQAFMADCGQTVADWKGQFQKRADLKQRFETVKTEVVQEKVLCDRDQANEKSKAAARKAQEGEFQQLAQQRQKLLGGKPVVEVEAGLDKAIATARASLDNARQVQQQTAEARARFEEAVRNAASRKTSLESEHGKAVAGLDAWLAAFNQKTPESLLSLEALKRLLAFDNAWIAQERTDLQALKQRVTSSEAVLDTHKAALEKHEAAKPTDATSKELEDSRTKLAASVASELETLNGLKLEIAQDDERLRQSASLRASLDKQQETSRVWARLSELIGSADGKKFRNFAQQLTLDVLLGYANRHLESLARRYRLLRTANSLGLMVGDQEMGDELRSVHSLSGGESFLVSLGLALGLASLSSHRVRVESLFIDEGFGSLDADALNIALEALDKLQALGRKVGVISHVHEMTERIGTRIQVGRQVGGASRVQIF